MFAAAANECGGLDLKDKRMQSLASICKQGGPQAGYGSSPALLYDRQVTIRAVVGAWVCKHPGYSFEQLELYALQCTNI